ncbi:MAG: hypothetical protein WA634_20450 [Silvibacterium sp.]
MNQLEPNQLHALQSMMMIMPFVVLIVTAIVIIPYWFIWKKAGFSPWLSLLMLVPLVNIIMPYVLAFSEWKVVPASQAITNFTYQYPSSPPPPPPQV